MSVDYIPQASGPAVRFDIPADKLDTLLLMQYKNSPNLSAYIGCFLSEINIISKAIQDTINFRYLSNATGKQMDTIGELVGLGRIFYGAAPLGYFGFYDDPQSNVPSIGDAAVPNIGGIYKSYGNANAADFVMDDTTYKRAIYAKIVKNQTNCSVEDVLLYIDLLVGRSCSTQITEGHCTSDIFIHENLTQIQRISLGLLIAGIRACSVAMTLRDNYGAIVIREPNYK